MHQVFRCKCGWLLYKPMTLPCGHTMCKHCMEEKMACVYCGYIVQSIFQVNILLVDLLKNWFKKEYKSTEHKRDALLLLESEDYELALTKVNLSIKLVDNDFTAYNIRADIHIGLKKYKKAMKDAHKSLELNKECGKSQFIKGICFSHMGNLNGAIDAFQLCLELEPDDIALSNLVVKKLDEILSLPDAVDKINSSGLDSSSEEETKDPENDTFRIQKNSNNQVKQQNNNEKSGGDNLISQKPSKTLSSNEEKVHGVPKDLLNESEFECRLCFELLYKPITTSCGHVFCKYCLIRSLDHSTNCPICRLSLVDILQSSLKMETKVLEDIIELFYPETLNKRKQKYLDRLKWLSRVGVDEEVEVPIFVCSIAFPYVKCPLHIFEPKYRLMIRECMESGSKKFGMCIPQSGGESYADVGIICELEKIQNLPDGRYIVNAVAGQRFIVKEKLSINSLEYAKVKYFKDEQPKQANQERFLVTSRQIYDNLSQYVNSFNTDERNCIYNALGVLPAYEGNPQHFTHGLPWVWWGIAVLPLNLNTKLVLLRSKCVNERMLSLERFLRFLTKVQKQQLIGNQENNSSN